MISTCGKGLPFIAAVVGEAAAPILKHEILMAAFGARWAEECGEISVRETLAADAQLIGFHVGSEVPIAIQDCLFEERQNLDHPALAAISVGGSPNHVVAAELAKGRGRAGGRCVATADTRLSQRNHCPRREQQTAIVVVVQSESNLFEVVLARRAASRAACTAGSKRATRTAMIAITTSNSMIVKPCRRRSRSFRTSEKGEDMTHSWAADSDLATD